MKILFCNIGWMESYRGLSAADQIVGGGSYVRAKGMGHEVCNFAEHRGTVYGYVQPPKAEGQPGGGQINIDRIGGKGLASVENVLVVWTATRPKVGSVVIGWYKNATVYRYYKKFKRIPALHKRNKLYGYRIKAQKSNVTLLPFDQRTFPVPRKVKGGMGHSNVWFAAARESQPTVRNVLALVAGKRPTARSKRTDPNHNAKVEQAAISTVRKHYENISYSVESVEKDNLGWDLEAQSGNVTLRIEVKGLSGPLANAQLTPNEFDAFSKNASSYRLAIVTGSLLAPRLLICRFSVGGGRWVVDGNDGCLIDIKIRQSATVLVRI